MSRAGCVAEGFSQPLGHSNSGPSGRDTTYATAIDHRIGLQEVPTSGGSSTGRILSLASLGVMLSLRLSEALVMQQPGQEGPTRHTSPAIHSQIKHADAGRKLTWGGLAPSTSSFPASPLGT